MRDYETIKGLLRGIAAGFRAKGNVHASKTCDDAADAIEELLAAVPRWISVEDELPEDYKYVLCVDEGNVIMGFYVDECGWGDMDTFRIYPTHWMPLPEPPKEVGEDG